MPPAKPRTSTQSQEVRPYHDDSSSSNGSEGGSSRTPPETLEEALPRHYPPQERPTWMKKTTQFIPTPIARTSRWVVDWCKGPSPPRVWHITPIFPKFQLLPIRLLDRIAPKRKHRIALLGAWYFCWLLCFITILNQSQFSEEISGYGAPSTISCATSFWDKNNGCGLNGNNCRPFQNTTFAFRCPANCASQQVLNPYAIGDQVITYTQQVIGGPNDTANSIGSAVYRGDSFVCAAAIQSGFITDSEGGCGVASLIGSFANFPSVDRNGIHSYAFDSNFPMAFRFLEETKTSCKDLRWPLLAVTTAFTAILAVCTQSPAVYFWSIFCAWFAHVALVSDPPSGSNNYELVSSLAGRFLPAAFVAFVLYKYICKWTLQGLNAQYEKTILWLGPCIVGCLNNYTFENIPIQRLTGHDLKQQPGAITALVIIVLVIFVIAVGQVWAFRMDGRLPRYLALYAFMGFCLLMLLAIPHMNLRIHHYILALLLLPGTTIQTRPSLVYQGLLVGLFINGIARWGFDSIIQTPAQLQGDALIGSELPMIHQPAVATSNITFTWDPIPTDFDGLSILVNDVERFRGYAYDGTNHFTWARHAPGQDPEYFRFAFMSGSSAGDYTRAGIWRGNGMWDAPPEGATK